ncbi:MAG TPA: M67 family metallopeptidase [Solirubrobacteraceae bacterium]|nr:M67 family metallopeptidase [Solirubrobacteraceae bacterium]
MRIAPALLERIVDHARRDFPNECCGLVASRDGTATEVQETENLAASPFRFEVDGLDLAHRLEAIEDRGDELGAIYHSHSRSAPYPSQTDVNFAAGWPGTEWIIVGLPRDGEPEVRSFRIEDGRIDEIGLVVDDG